MARIKTSEDHFNVKETQLDVEYMLNTGYQFIALHVHTDSEAFSGDKSSYKKNYKRVVINRDHIMKVYDSEIDVQKNETT